MKKQRLVLDVVTADGYSLAAGKPDPRKLKVPHSGIV